MDEERERRLDDRITRLLADVQAFRARQKQERLKSQARDARGNKESQGLDQALAAINQRLAALLQTAERRDKEAP